jgi:hypothetical protein
MATPSHANPMSTPLNNLPLNTQQTQNDVNDLQDPLVQDVLKEFEEEVAAARKAPHQMMQQQQPQMMQQQPQMMHQQPQMMQQQQQPQMMPQQIQNPYQIPPYSDNKKYFDINIIKKSVIFSIIAVLIFYPCLYDFIVSKLPESIMDTFTKFDIYIKFILLCISYYLIIYFDYLI